MQLSFVHNGQKFMTKCLYRQGLENRVQEPTWKNQIPIRVEGSSDPQITTPRVKSKIKCYAMCVWNTKMQNKKKCLYIQNKDLVERDEENKSNAFYRKIF